MTISNENIIVLILIPLISALIGWFTNYLAIKSLFRPIKELNLGFFKIQGLIPKRKTKLALKLAQIVEEYFLSHNDIQDIFTDEKEREKIKIKILPILENKILDKIPSMFKLVASPIITKILAEEIDDLISKFSQEISSHIEENIDIKKIVFDKIISYDISKLEIIIRKIASKELKHIELLGGVIGFVVGLFQVFLLLVL
ncbi:MAG: DUF445 family protein [Nanoarchaeota archaeon]|nr:DUF445 family protein [Nanoarchaeota archaeon]